MRLGVLVLMAGALALSACAKPDKDDGVEAGYCTQATIDAYNNIVSKAYWKADAENSVANSCKSIQDLLQGRSCKAQSVLSGEEKSISYANVQSICESKLNPSSPTKKVSSKYISEEGTCTALFYKDAKEISRLLDKAVKNRLKDYSDKAGFMCRQIGVELRGQTCKTYDVVKKEFITNSETEGTLGQLCDGAKKISQRLSPVR